MLSGSNQTVADRSAGERSAAAGTARSVRSYLILLHALVAIALSCQLIFSAQPSIPTDVKELIVLGLVLSTVLVRLLPQRLWERRGVVEGLVLSDTAITTGLIYVSGNAAPDLYLTYFLIILIATLSHRLTQMLSLSLGICAAYAAASYWGVDQTDTLSENHLLRISVLVVMAVFHGAAIDRVRFETAGRKRAEESLRLSEQLRELQKMEAVGRLAGGLAHDFNNMLTVISGHAELILMTLDELHPMRKEAEQIRQAAERAASLTRQVLAFSRKQVLDPKVINPTTVLSNLERMLGRLLGEGIDFTVVVEGKPGRICVDVGQLEQSIINLAINARDAMPFGGALTIRVSNVDKTSTAAESGSLPPGRYVTLAMTDTGIGMDPDTQARIFEPFFTTKDQGKGTGLGLATVYGIVKQSEGEIVVDSAPGRGSTFTIYLPRVDTPVDSVSPRFESRPVSGSETILLVEDEPMLRQMVRIMLRAQGYVVLEGEDGTEALRMAREYERPIHLLLTDVLMPRMNGRQVADRLTALRKGLRVLFISGYPDEVIAGYRVPGPDGAFLHKPFSYETLSRTVRQVLDSPTAVTDSPVPVHGVESVSGAPEPFR